MPECNRCHTPITWTKRAGRSVPLNIDGTDHHCKDGVNIPSTEKPPTQIGKLIMYAGNQAMLLLKDGKEHSYAITSEVLKDWQGCGFLLPAENHPDVWLDFSVDPKGFIRPGANVVLCPDWSKSLTDPTNGKIKTPFKSGKEILEQKLKEKIAEGTAKPAVQPAAQPSAQNPPPKGKEQASVSGSPAPATNPPSCPNGEAIHEMLENIANADPRVIEYLKKKEPELMKAFAAKMESPLLEVNGRKKGPVEEDRFPSDDELLKMVYNYDTYWKSKTVMDLMARQDIRQQVIFKNRMDSVNAAIALLNDGVHKPNENEILVCADTLYKGIQQQIAKVK